MSKYLTKLISLILSLNLILEQSLFAQAIDLSRYLNNPVKSALQSDKFRPLHLRYLGYDNLSRDFKLFLDKGDTKKEDLENKAYIEENTQTLLKYFFIGLTLPNEKFWVNLRPDSPDNILDPELEKTDIGRIFLEADVQLKKDTAGMTSPQTPEGKAYWDKLYKKAGELFGSENITIPTITRPWIVPNEIIIREAPDNAYIYKATLKVMLEEDYLSRGRSRTAPTLDGSRTTPTPDQYTFSDPRLKELNQYSTQIIKETIIPKLTYAVNTSKRYAPLRQVYYSLILAQWFKAHYRSRSTENRGQITEKANNYRKLIDSGDLTNFTSKEPYDKQSYFKQYQKSFAEGEYNLQEPVYTPMGQSIRRYMSGGVKVGQEITAAMSPIAANKRVFSLGSSPIGKEELSPAYLLKAAIKIQNETGQEGIWLPKQLYDTDGNPITNNKGAIMGLPKGEEAKIITDIPQSVINQYGVSNKKITVIAGFDEKILRKAIEWAKKRRVGLLSPASNMNSLIIQFLKEMEIFPQGEIDSFESWLKGKGKGKRKNISGRIVGEAVERIEYLLYPDEEILPFLNVKRRVEIMDLLSSAYGLKNIQTHRSIDLLITLLEKGIEKADYGPERTKIKVLLAKTDRKLFSGEDLARIKKIILKTKELPEEFLGRERAVNMLQGDDAARIEKIIPLIENLESISDLEWSGLIQECAAIGWPMLYGNQIDKLSFPEENKSGIEFEYFGKENEDNGELRIPAYEKGEKGFKNTASDWKKVEEELLGNTDKIIASFHIHIDRSKLNTLRKEKAVIRIAKALEAFWYRLGPRGDVPQIYLDKVAPVSFSDFFWLGGADFNHYDIANFSSRHNTVEFRFFRAPIRRYTAARAEFDLSMLQDMVAISMQIVNAAAREPRDFTLINTGLPRLLGMGNSLISPRYIRTAIERLYRDDIMGKIGFIRVFFNKELGFDWRKESDKDWIDSENEVEKEYNERGLGFLYRLHKKKGGWDSNIYQTLRDIIGEIENNPQLISDYGGIEELLSWMVFNGETEEEVRLGEEGIKRIQGEDYLYILKNVKIVPDILDIPLVKQSLNDSGLDGEEKLIKALNILPSRLIEQVMLKFKKNESEFMRLADLIREIPDQQKKTHCALYIMQLEKSGFYSLPRAIGVIAVNLSDENKETVISGLSGYIAAHPGLFNAVDFIRTQADIAFSLNDKHKERHILDLVEYAQYKIDIARSMIINVLEENWFNLALPVKNDILLKLSGYLANEDPGIRKFVIDALTGNNILLSSDQLKLEDYVIMSIHYCPACQAKLFVN